MSENTYPGAPDKPVRRWGENPRLERKKRLGKWLCLALLALGLADTLLFLFGDLPLAWACLVPFSVGFTALSNMFDPTALFLLLAVIPLVGWLLLHLRVLRGREVIIGAMIVYLALGGVFTPLYLIIGMSVWDHDYVNTFLLLSICGFVYPILVLIALHWWNPRRI